METYVEIKFYAEGCPIVIDRTWCDEGKDPNWNEIKSFLFKSKGEKFTKQQLIDDQTMIYVSVFDRQMFSYIQDGKQITLEEHRFLGSMSIPMKTILQNPPKIEFSFKIKRPLILPSYMVVPDEVYFIDSNEKEKLDDAQIRKNEQVPSYLTLSISLDPALELPSENEQNGLYPGAERQDLLTEGNNWVI